ncbi:hypothetical protein [Flavobacterium sp.]|jgi:uncharacterized lipoprotein NlpE involved in copper resistance|uniref:hypothetical protein n=1 Tax=Flavobacterium sp. TaxID=239 RepID=UPI0037BF46BE
MKKVVLSLAFVAAVLVSCNKKADGDATADSTVTTVDSAMVSNDSATVSTDSADVKTDSSAAKTEEAKKEEK